MYEEKIRRDHCDQIGRIGRNFSFRSDGRSSCSANCTTSICTIETLFAFYASIRCHCFKPGVRKGSKCVSASPHLLRLARFDLCCWRRLGVWKHQTRKHILISNLNCSDSLGRLFSLLFTFLVFLEFPCCKGSFALINSTTEQHHKKQECPRTTTKKRMSRRLFERKGLSRWRK